MLSVGTELVDRVSTSGGEGGDVNNELEETLKKRVLFPLISVLPRLFGPRMNFCGYIRK